MDFIRSKSIQSRKLGIFFYYLFVIIVFVCAVANLLMAIFPIDYELGHDEAEHLHVAYLLGQGQRPYIDFIENHPTLFNHFLNWVRTFFNLKTVRQWAFIARVTILFHIILMFFVFYLWISKIIRKRPGGLLWLSIIFLSFSFVGYYNEQLALMWQIRPDWISYAYSLIGLFLFFLYVSKEGKQNSLVANLLLLLPGAFFVGLGNAILPKGFILIMGICAGLITLLIIRKLDIEYFISRRFIIGTLVFTLFSFLTFWIFAIIDCYLSKITIKSWIKANFIINSIKHLPLTNDENNPISSFMPIFSINFILFLLLCFWSAYYLSEERENNYFKINTNLLIIAIFVIITNIFITAFGNGLSWPHYFIPCVFGALLIYLILLLDVHEKIKRLFQKDLIYPRRFLSLLPILIITIIPAKQLIEVYPAFLTRQANLSNSLVSKNNDYLNDAIMPPNLLYFSPKPTEMPIMAKHSGYYFMLVIDKKIWQDFYRLGLGPNPEENIRNVFDQNCPDIVALQGPIKLYEFISTAYKVQEINLEWLIDTVQKNYVLISKSINRVYVKKDLVPYMESLGWKKVTQ